MRNFDVVVIGSGFAGSILARCLRSAGRSVLVLERGAHPRFALGESSTPLANLSLERLALRYGLRDLYHQAAWARWQKHLQRQGGLKRGFTFFAPQRGEDVAPTGGLWVAASPNDATADSQWLRSSVDAALVARARAEGVELLERATLRDARRSGASWRLEIEAAGGSHSVTAGFLVDASGGARFASQHLGAGSVSSGTRSRLVFGHFEGVPEPPTPSDAPYSSCWSAVHHLLDDSWMYELRFADGTVSAGLLSRSASGAPTKERSGCNESALRPWPWLARRFEGARPLRPVAEIESVGYRAETAVGDGWAALPHSFSFVDPLFSAGIAWSLLGVERVADVLLRGGDWQEYDSLLQREADHLEALIDAAYLALGDFERFSRVARTYFVAASFQETCQRLLGVEELNSLDVETCPSWCWSGLLGATDSVVRSAVTGLRHSDDETFRDLLALRDVAGFSQDRSVYAVDLEPLRDRSALLGLDRGALEKRLPRLFSPDSFAAAAARVEPASSPSLS